MTRMKLLVSFVLIMLLPLQSLAAGYQRACFMQQHVDAGKSVTPSCHDHMMMQDSEMQSAKMQDAEQQKSSEKKSDHAYKSKCISVCAQANMAALPSNISLNTIELVFNDYPPLQRHYLSITLPAFQRPPISLS